MSSATNVEDLMEDTATSGVIDITCSTKETNSNEEVALESSETPTDTTIPHPKLTSTSTDVGDQVLTSTTETIETETNKEDDVVNKQTVPKSSSSTEIGEGGSDMDGATTPSIVTATATTTLPAPTSPTQGIPLRTGKRPSPWREPRTTGRPPPPAREMNHSSTAGTASTILKKHVIEDAATLHKKEMRRKKKKERRLKYLCSGSIFVDIPLSVTADLGIALRRGREHRIRALHRHFPSLQHQLQQQIDSTDSAVADGNEPNSTNGISTEDNVLSKKSDGKTAPKKILRHVPQPHEYANVIDYLEAKYVQGVVISDDLEDYDDDTGGNVEEDDEEGHGSVYSETSFLDDTGLQRTIAEQVLGHTTTTKLELMNHEDGGFFVNVGDLEVEETDLTQEMYDPIHDINKVSFKKNKKTRKRKASISESDTAVATNKPTGPFNGKKTQSTKPAAKLIPKAAAVETTSNVPAKTTTATKKIKVEEKKPGLGVSISPKAKKETVGKSDSIIHKNPVTMKLQKIATKKRDEITEHYNKLKMIIDNLTDEELPRKRKPKRTRVVVKVPSGNQPGDTITFANPHVPGQKLKVKVPANVKAGETFKVTVPKPAEDDNDDDKLGEDGLARDHNKFNREFYDVLDDYAKAYDEWCDAEGAYRRAIDDKTFTSHFMKRNKCDDLVSLFPDDTKTSISIDYLKKVIRRARQNKHKRELTMAKQQISFIEEHQDLIEQNSDDDGSNGEDGGDDDNENDDTPNNNANSSDDEGDHENGALQVPTKALSSSKASATIKKGAKPTRTAILPDFSNAFCTIPFHVRDFAEVS